MGLIAGILYSIDMIELDYQTCGGEIQSLSSQVPPSCLGNYLASGTIDRGKAQETYWFFWGGEETGESETCETSYWRGTWINWLTRPCTFNAQEIYKSAPETYVLGNFILKRTSHTIWKYIFHTKKTTEMQRLRVNNKTCFLLSNWHCRSMYFL